MKKINAMFKRLAAKGEKALIPYVTAGDPRSRDNPGAGAGNGPAGGRPHRTGHPFLGPAGRRPHHPGRLSTSPETGGQPAEDYRPGAFSASGHRHPAGAHGVLQSHSCPTGWSAWPGMRPRPGSTALSSRTCRARRPGIGTGRPATPGWRRFFWPRPPAVPTASGKSAP